MITWKPFAAWPPRQHKGKHFIFWQPAAISGRSTLPPRIIPDSAGGGSRETTHYAEVQPPGSSRMARVDAITELMREARSDRKFTQTSISRVLKQCRTLSMTRAETIRLLNWLDACDVNGNPWRSGYAIDLPPDEGEKS